MKIESVDKACWVNIECNNDSSGYAGFEVMTHADICHGQFDAKNIDVQFLNWEEFLTEYDRFILDRSLTPRLEGTYDTYIAFSASGSIITFQYSLGDAFCGRKTIYFHQSGEFEVEQENLLRLLDGFRGLMLARK